MKKKSIHKGWSWLACAVLGLALLFACPLAVNAEDDPVQDPVTYIDENGEAQMLTSYHTNQEAGYNTPAGTGIYWWGQTSGDNWLVLTEDMTCSGPIYLSSKGDTFHLVLCDGVTLTAEQGINILCKGLKIYSTSLGDQMGTLIAKSSTVNSAIGRSQVNDNSSDPDIMISGGNIQATVDGAKINPSGGLEDVQDVYPAAIGMCGRTGSSGANGGGCITINNGNVTADCSAVPYASAIETKMFERTSTEKAGEIRINGGQVTARAHVDLADETKCGTGIGQRLVYKQDGTPRQISTEPVQITLGWKDQESDFIDTTSWNGQVKLADENKSFVYDDDPTELADLTELKAGKLLPAIVRTLTFTQSRLEIDATERVPDGQLAAQPEIDLSKLGNYIFYGWYEDLNDKATRFSFDEPVTRDYELTGKLDSSAYKLIFDMRGKGGDSVKNFIKGAMPETIPETTAAIDEKGNIVVNQQTDVYSYAEWANMTLNLDDPPKQEGYLFLGFENAEKTPEDYASYEAAKQSLDTVYINNRWPKTDTYNKTKTYFAIWAEETQNIAVETEFPKCGTEVDGGVIKDSDGKVLIYDGDQLFTGQIEGGHTYSIRIREGSWPKVMTADTTATVNGEVAELEIEGGSNGFYGTVSTDFTAEHTWGFYKKDGQDGEVEWVEQEDGSFRAFVNYECKADGNHKEQLEAKVTEKREYYCRTGYVDYTARLNAEDTPDNEQRYGTKRVSLSAPGHDWDEPVYTWSEDYSELTAAIVCKNAPNEHHPTETVKTTGEIIKEATYTEEGEAVYTSAQFTTEDDINHKPLFEAQTIRVTIPVLEKMTNPLTVKAKTVKLKAKKLKKKNQNIARKKAMTVSKGKGTVTYTKVKVNKKKFAKKFTINKKTGKITVKKGVKKGTYKMTVKVNAAGTVEYKPLARNVVVKIVVK